MTGIILINKPRHMSSNTVVNVVKHQLNLKKAGHLGTLDVEAQGLLPVTLNSSTKLFDYFLNKNKEYITTFKFGEETSTLDLESEIIKKDNKIISAKQVLDILPSFIGKQMQLPPVYSSKKINGKRAYELARAGENFNLDSKMINIFDIKLLEQTGINKFKFLISCSSGTYIRSICRDMAHRLSTFGTCYDITRTKCGNFDIKDSYTLEQIKKNQYHIIEPQFLFDYKEIQIDHNNETKLLNGQIINHSGDDGKYKIFSSIFLGIGEIKNNKLKLIMRLF